MPAVRQCGRVSRAGFQGSEEIISAVLPPIATEQRLRVVMGQQTEVNLPENHTCTCTQSKHVVKSD